MSCNVQGLTNEASCETIGSGRQPLTTASTSSERNSTAPLRRWGAFFSPLTACLSLCLAWGLVALPLGAQTCPWTTTVRQEVCPVGSACATKASTLTYQELDRDLLNTVGLCAGPGLFTWPASPSAGILTSNSSGTISLNSVTLTPTSNGGPFRMLATGSTLTGATNQGLRHALFSLFDTNTSSLQDTVIGINFIQQSGVGTIQRTGIDIRGYTQPDNGGDTSLLLGVQTGGGCGLCIYQLPGMRPSGYTNYESTLQGAIEAGTGAQNFAIMGVSGSQLGGATTNESTAVLARVDNAASRGVVIFPNDSTFDTRDALVVGYPQVNADPVLIKSRLLMNGKMSLGLVSTPDTRLTLSDNASTSSPAPLSGTLLHMLGTDSTTLRITADSFAAQSSYEGRRSSGTLGSPSALASGDVITAFTGFGYGSTGYSSGGRVSIQLKTAEAWTDTAQGTQVSFFVTPNTTATAVETFRFDNTGHLLTTASAPSIACTGTGTSPASPTIVGSDTAFTATVNTGTGTPGSTGTCTVTFSKPFTTNIPVMSCMLARGATSWGNGATIQLTTESLSAPVLTWTNLVGGVATTLTVSTSYKFNCIVIGR